MDCRALHLLQGTDGLAQTMLERDDYMDSAIGDERHDRGDKAYDVFISYRQAYPDGPRCVVCWPIEYALRARVASCWRHHDLACLASPVLETFGDEFNLILQLAK